MRISEVIVSKKHTFDILQSQEVIRFDKLYDELKSLSRKFSIPVDMFNEELISEYLEKSTILHNEMTHCLPPDSEWIVKATVLLNYLRGK